MTTFEWDPPKADKNLGKHGITFEQAITAFDDPAGIIQEDLKHSTPAETRHLRIGLSDAGVLVIAYTERESRTRIISARRANHRERNLYEANLE
jgi:uncharacterized protein